MKYLFIILSLIVLNSNLQAQTKDEKKRAELEREYLEKKAEYIAKIVNSFELDEFQKHILTQRLDSYYDELAKIQMQDIKTFEKTALISDLDSTHFKEFEDMLGREFVDKLLIKAKGKDKSNQKKKKKKKRRTKTNH